MNCECESGRKIARKDTSMADRIEVNITLRCEACGEELARRTYYKLPEFRCVVVHVPVPLCQRCFKLPETRKVGDK